MAALAFARNAAVGSRHCGCRLAAGSRISSAAWVTLVALLVGGVCCQTSRAVSGQRAIAEAAQRPPTTDVSSFTSGNAAKAYPQSSPSLLTSSCPARDASCMCPAASARPAFSPFCSLCEPFLSHQPVCTLKNLVRKNAWPMGLPEQGTLLPRFFLHSSTSTCSPPGLRHPN